MNVGLSIWIFLAFEFGFVGDCVRFCGFRVVILGLSSARRREAILGYWVFDVRRKSIVLH
ncbi:hypothetical protein RchiOBHm_Chr4g0402901 [Rosa chinensis]|uniref:Uncharacterized protein n=1 Tax=Rosa chinensis TaxID=74649 RepID=A0A2P6QTF8_ROSCH|nr:hypothetical protein RchiOBHm_Chr4g0402901 [Rosa chinensis]